MTKLTAKEEEIMIIFWAHGDMFIRDVLKYFDEPKPHYNTVATQIGFLEEKGLLERQAFANSFRYHPLVSEREYRSMAMSQVVRQFYDNSYSSVISQFVEEEKMDVEELKNLIALIENKKR